MRLFIRYRSRFPGQVAAVIAVVVAGADFLPAAPDRIFINAEVVPMTRPDETAEAVAVEGERITAVGTNADIRALAGPETEIVDLAGQALLPGFYAAHDHFPSAGSTALFQVDLNSPPIGPIRDMDDLVAALKEKADRTPKGKWVTGRGYDDTLLAEQRHPTREDLDRASVEHPIWITHTSGHLGVGNSLALKLAKITRDTPQPSGGVIRMDPKTGEPNGVIEERGSLVSRLTPNRTFEERLESIKVADQHYLTKGVTTTVIAGGGMGSVPDLVQARKDGLLHLRCLAMLAGNTGTPPTLDAVARLSPFPEYVRISGVKYWQDGSLQGLTGYLTQPYVTQPEGKTGYAGYPSRSRDALTKVVLAYHNAGYQIAIHGNGDAAIDDILAAYRAAQEQLPRPDARHRIEHCQTPRPDQLDTMRELGITPSFFVGHVYYWGDRHRDLFLGSERAARISPLRSALERGLKFTIHNDTPVTPVDPLLLVWCAVNRQMKDGTVLGPEERIGVYEALRAVTVDAAWQNFEEATKGTIEPGKFADFVVLAENPLTVEPTRLKDLEIRQTIVGGQTVYQRK